MDEFEARWREAIDTVEANLKGEFRSPEERYRHEYSQALAGLVDAVLVKHELPDLLKTDS